MSVIKSFSVGDGDTFYIDHNNGTLTLIDCCLTDDNREAILAELAAIQARKEIIRFISTHPDEDHLRGLEFLDNRLSVANFYVVKNDATKQIQTDSFIRYCALRDSGKAFFIEKGCRRKWMNVGDETRDGSGIYVLWPDIQNVYFRDALLKAANGESPNNICPIITYSLQNGVKAVWMGDLETDFMEAIADEVPLSAADVVFAPHHGRESGKIPHSMLDKLTPRIIVIGEAPSRYLNYYGRYNTITQNSAGDLLFDCVQGKVHIYSSNKYRVNFLDYDPSYPFRPTYLYVGTLNVS